MISIIWIASDGSELVPTTDVKIALPHLTKSAAKIHSSSVQIRSICWEDNLRLNRPGLKTMYLQVMDMLYAMEPKLLFFLQATLF